MKRSELIIRAIILPLDYLGVLLSFVIAYELREYLGESFLIPFNEFVPLAVALSVLWILVLWLSGVYRLDIQRNTWEEIFGVLLGSLASVTIASSLIFFIKEIDFSRLVLLTTTTIGFLLLLIIRLLRELFLRYLYTQGIGIHRVMIVGQGDTTQIVLAGIDAENDPGMKVVDVVKVADFDEKFDRFSVDEIIQTDPTIDNATMTHIITVCEESGVLFRFVPNLFEVPAANVATYNLAGVPIVTLSVTAVDGWYAVFKRGFDIIGALVGIVVLFPVFILTAVAVKLDSKGPLFFLHKRVGRNGCEFPLIKFRSMAMHEVDGKLMHADTNKEVEDKKNTTRNYKLEHDPRVTRVGRFIRKTSLDELPQLFNVLKGELSLVGPRAYLKKELDWQLVQYPEAKGMVRRLTTVRPGITGIWQVSGRSTIDFSERVAMDAYYATHATLPLDIKILLQTIPVVLRGTGAV